MEDRNSLLVLSSPLQMMPSLILSFFNCIAFFSSSCMFVEHVGDDDDNDDKHNNGIYVHGNHANMAKTTQVRLTDAPFRFLYIDQLK
mmetsp:Transcript_14183/g.20796  ORF Transcript_14183/g.20796 Transcript_14183/m.20796 type:complete len:87 (+) Transcript_14183:1118-1378(+)